MKVTKTITLGLCTLVLVAGCSSWSNTANGALIGTGGGAALGAVVGKLAGNTAVGAAIGATVGAGAGALIGKKMDKAAEAAAKVEGAEVQQVTDANGLQAVKVTFDSGILFATNKSNLNESAKTSLNKFAEVLKNYSDADVAIFGHTDNTGSLELNQSLSEKRAASVADYLKARGVKAEQIAEVVGKNFSEPVADNSTKEGRAENRRVEVFMYASTEMINAANNGTLK